MILHICQELSSDERDKGRRQKKKLVLLGGRDQKMATTPPPPPVMVKVQVFFVEKFFFAYNPLKRKKKLSDLKVKFLPPPSQPQLCQIFPLDESN